MVILLGLLIFVHELGHFLVAKYFKVRVEVFSLGFGKKLLSFRRGETEYCISAIPLGGYVKMYGDDPSAEVPEADRQGSFLHKPVSQRIAVVLAGPLMNLLFAFILYTAIAMMGEKAVFPALGDVEPTSSAWAAGFRPGDTIVAVEGRAIETYSTFDKALQERAGLATAVKVQRESGTIEVLNVTPKLGANPNILALKREVGQIEGLTFLSRSSTVAVIGPETAAGKAGLRSGDAIVKINSTPIRRWRELLASSETFAKESELAITVQRGLLESLIDESSKPQTIELKLTVPAAAKGKSGLAALNALGFDDPSLYLASIEKDSPAEKAGLKPGDLLLSIDGKALSQFEQVVSQIRTFDGKQPLQFTIARGGVEQTLAITPDVKARMNNQAQEEKRFEVGIRPMIIEDNPLTVERSTSNLVEAIERGAIRSAEMSGAVAMGFVRLVQGEVSSKNIGGFLSIGQMAKKSWGMGLVEFFLAMAVISINLFVINLLPVPVLDGGHLVFYTIEAVRGAPVSMKKMELAQKVGAALLVGLMVFALFNDVTRLLFR